MHSQEFAPFTLPGALDRPIRNHDVKQGDYADLVNGRQTLLKDFPFSDGQLIAHAEGQGGAVLFVAGLP